MRAILVIHLWVDPAFRAPDACARTHVTLHAVHRNDQGTLACLGAAR
jgi:hypothetical protein